MVPGEAKDLINSNMGKFKLLKLEKLKPHEQIQLGHFKELKKEILSDGFLKEPIIVDINTMVVLDGHHRFNILKKLGYKFVPAWVC